MLPLLDEVTSTALSVANLITEVFRSPTFNLEGAQNSQRIALNEDVTTVVTHVLQQRKQTGHLGIWF